mmetsp:Transcript_92/g.252  ORF Transcript_92/g.252 Transcript_92/m.252 type:complete len:620 (-) Transcript_92:93-1952(-)
MSTSGGEEATRAEDAREVTGTVSAIREQAANASYVGGAVSSVESSCGRGVIDWENASIKDEVLRMIAAYLQGEGYSTSSMMLMDEANMRRAEGKRAEQEWRTWSKKVKKAIIEGEWAEVEKFCNKSSIKSMKNFLYCVYKQQYLELVDRQEYQKAFTYLTKKLKPFEKQRAHPEEFKDLCYLLTCKSIADVDKDWEGIAAARMRLASMFNSLLADSEGTDTSSDPIAEVPHGRMRKLLEQAVEYQISTSHYQPKILPPITTLLRDYECFVLPNAVKHEYKGHTSNVKCIAFMGADKNYLVSGSSDQTLRVWNVAEPHGGLTTSLLLRGHTSRIWDISIASSGNTICSASGDSTVKIWNVEDKFELLNAAGSSTSRRPSEMRTWHQGKSYECDASETLVGHKGDVYAIACHPEDPKIVVSGGYDKYVRLWNVDRSSAVRSFHGHTASVTCLTYSSQGNLVISGSKDASVRFWDMNSGLEVNSLNNVGDVTSLDLSSNGLFLLTASKGNSNRLWDLRKIGGGESCKAVRLYKGNQNTFTNFIRASFGPAPSLVMSGSEDGYVYIWDRESGSRVQRLGGANSIIYSAAWSSRQSTLASSSHDGIVRTWWYDEKLPMEFGATV